MELFGQIVRTLVNTALLPLDVAEDVVEGDFDFNETSKRLEKLKKESGEANSSQ